MMTSRILAIVAAVVCSISGTASATNLKPIEPRTLQNTVEATAKELLLPGVIVLLHAPPRQICFWPRHDGAWRQDTAPRRHLLQDRLEYQDDDGRCDRAARTGRENETRRMDNAWTKSSRCLGSVEVFSSQIAMRLKPDSFVGLGPVQNGNFGSSFYAAGLHGELCASVRPLKAPRSWMPTLREAI